MGLFRRTLRQDVTYWAPGAPDQTGGVSYAAPVNIKGRWEERAELFIDANGNEVRSSAVVYLAVDVVLEGYLLLGISTATTPVGVPGSFAIRSFRKIPDIRARNFERKAML